MKFSSSLKFNAVADWWDDYIAYDSLKRSIYQLEKQFYAQPQHRPVSAPSLAPYRDDLEASTTEAQPAHDPNAIFISLLDRELSKITEFYTSQEKEFFKAYQEIAQAVRELDERDPTGQGTRYYGEGEGDEDDDDDDDDDDESMNIGHSIRRRLSSSPVGRRRRQHSTSSAPLVNVFQAPAAPSQYPPPTEPASPITPHAHFQVLPPSSPNAPRHRHQSHSSYYTLPRSRTRSRSLGARGAIDRFTGALQSLKDSFTSESGGAPAPMGQADESALSIWTSDADYAYDTRLLFKRRLTRLYISLTHLRSYAELNFTGFRKILKKYDKVIPSSSSLQSFYPGKIQQAYPFQQETKARLEETIQNLISLYAKCVTFGEAGAAKTQLKAHQREQIAWERDTVWRLMIGHERRGDPVEIGLRAPTSTTLIDGEEVIEEATVGGGATLVYVREPDPGLFQIPFPGTRRKDGKRRTLRVTKKRLWILLALASLVGIVKAGLIQTISKGKKGGPISVDYAANDCFAILAFCTILWASEAIPLFVTSLSVPFLLVVLRVIRNEDEERLSTSDATKFVFSVIFSPTIMLLIGGFTISSALSKTNIDKLLITRVLSLAGTKPSKVLLAFMGVSCFASMWISNVAAPTLCFTLIRPILRTLPPKSPFAPCLILAIALAANIGGQSSPISSPQNLIALDAMDGELDWVHWFAVSLPVSAISIILIWLLLLVSYRPSRLPPTVEEDLLDDEDWTGLYRELEIKPIRPTREVFTAKQYWVTCVCLVTISLWCVAHEIEYYLGDMGIIAIMPILAFFGTGVLKKDDFERFAWSIVFLAMGGIALGKGVVSSGLLKIMDVVIRDMLDGFSLYTVVLVLSPVVLVISTFISHTIASVLLVPIAKEVGKSLPGRHSNLLIFITALICSTGMGMPVSGFPNQTAAAQEDELGEPYLNNVDFLKNGVPASVIATLVVVTVGFVLMKVIGL